MFLATQAVHDGVQIYVKISCPLLAIFNEPTPPALKADSDAKARADAERFAAGLKGLHEQEEAFRALGPNAHVVLIKDATHYIFRSNEADVIHDIDAFIAALP